VVEALEGAKSLQLYQLKAFIEGMLADPRRGIAARASLHLGQPVQFAARIGQQRQRNVLQTQGDGLPARDAARRKDESPADPAAQAACRLKTRHAVGFGARPYTGRVCRRSCTPAMLG